MKTEVIPMVASLSLSCSHHDARPKSKNSVQQNENVCPDCGATAPVTTPEGFTACSACGCEYPDSQPYVCSDPLGHDKGVIQSHMIARQGMTTMVGTRSERAQSARTFQWADRIGKTFEQEVLQRAYFEVRKILTILDLDPRSALFDAAMAGFAKAYRAIPKGTRNRNVHLLAMASTYRAMRASRVPIGLKLFITSCLDHAQFTARQFLTTLNDTTRLFPKINPGEMVPYEVSALVSRLGIPKSIQEAVAIILKHHINAFRSPKTAVRAAAILGTAIIATGQRRRFPLSAIARSAGIATSAVIRCILGACAYNHCSFEGSLVYAGDILRSLFLAPGKIARPDNLGTVIMKTHVRVIVSRAKLPPPVATAAIQIASNHGDAFLQRTVKASAGAIVSTAILAKGSRKRTPLISIARHARTNYLTMARYIAKACEKMGHPLPVKLAWAGDYLRSFFLDGPPGLSNPHQTGPPVIGQENPLEMNLQGGPPNIVRHVNAHRSWYSMPGTLMARA